MTSHRNKIRHTTLCRVFVAYREEMTGTWINNYSPFVSGFSTEADATTLTSTEVRAGRSQIPFLSHQQQYRLVLSQTAGLAVGMCICPMTAKPSCGWQHHHHKVSLQLAESRSLFQMLCIQARSIPGPDVYLAAAYWSLTTVSTIGFGDILPITNAERAVMLMSQITGVLFFGILLGSITSLLQVNLLPLVWILMLCCAVLCCAVLCCAVLCCAVLCSAVQCSAVLCCAVLCGAV